VSPPVYDGIVADEKTSPLRPYFASAILRLARPMNNLEYESFIDLQDKLHQNLCRMRKFVAIGTHDLDTIEGPFRYAMSPTNDSAEGKGTCAVIPNRSSLRR
jgi:phenylalanyl-tRNA synthetase beta chain